jgi:hypothetical protein
MYKLLNNVKLHNMYSTTETKNLYDTVVHCHPNTNKPVVKVYTICGKIKEEYMCNNMYFKHNNVYLMKYVGNNVWTIFCGTTAEKILHIIKEYFSNDVCIINKYEYPTWLAKSNEKSVKLPIGKYLSTAESKIMWAKNVKLMLDIQQHHNMSINKMNMLSRKSSSNSSQTI